jgi:hypothetical protein
MFSELDFAFLFSLKERIRGPDEVLWYKNSDKKSLVKQSPGSRSWDFV